MFVRGPVAVFAGVASTGVAAVGGGMGVAGVGLAVEVLVVVVVAAAAAAVAAGEVVVVVVGEVLVWGRIVVAAVAVAVAAVVASTGLKALVVDLDKGDLVGRGARGAFGAAGRGMQRGRRSVAVVWAVSVARRSSACAGLVVRTTVRRWTLGSKSLRPRRRTRSRVAPGEGKQRMVGAGIAGPRLGVEVAGKRASGRLRWENVVKGWGTAVMAAVVAGIGRVEDCIAVVELMPVCRIREAAVGSTDTHRNKIVVVQKRRQGPPCRCRSSHFLAVRTGTAATECWDIRMTLGAACL